MNVRIDKRLFEILNQQGVEITWEQFRAAYSVRQEERWNDPKAVAKRKREEERNARFLADMRDPVKRAAMEKRMAEIMANPFAGMVD